MYELKNFKTFKGHEGEPLAQGTLHIVPGGKVADWSDDSHGGCMDVRFDSEPAEDAFIVWAKTFLTTFTDYEGKPHDVAAMSPFNIVETAVQRMSFDYEEERQIAAHCKKGITYFSMVGGVKTLHTWKTAFTAANVARLRSDIGADLVEICNERLKMPFVDGELFAIAERNKHYKKLCKTQTLFSVRDSATGVVKDMVTKSLYSASIAAQLRARHPTLVEIINERYL